jgi:hypothetical protein
MVSTAYLLLWHKHLRKCHHQFSNPSVASPGSFEAGARTAPSMPCLPADRPGRADALLPARKARGEGENPTDPPRWYSARIYVAWKIPNL